VRFPEYSEQSQNEIAELECEEEAILAERERREKGKNEFAEFFRITTGWNPEPMQADMGNLIEQVSIHRATSLRELIHKPPQHGGSITITQEFIPFYLGWNTEKRVRLLTYGITHSEHFSDTIVKIMQSPEYEELFGWRLPTRVKSSEWSTPHRAKINDSQHSFMALGLQSGFVGSGGDLIIIDDAYANDKEPFSGTINEGIKKTFNEVVRTRANPETNVVVMAHSWNEKDLRAWLIKQGGWNDTRYAAICDSENDPLGRKIGEPLSSRYPVEYLLGLRDGGFDKDGNAFQGMGLAAFNSLYQGNGMSRDGSLVKLEWFDYVKDFQKASAGFLVRYWDWASSPQPTADRTSGALIYKNPIGKYTLLDLSYGRFSPGDRNKFIENTIRSDNEKYKHLGKVIQVIEAPKVSVEIVTGIRKYLAEKGFATVADEKTATKESRAEYLFTQMELGNVSYLLAPWNQPMQEEMLGFPNAEHDDLVDSPSGAIHFANKIKIV